jgi:hypothetical protein
LEERKAKILIYDLEITPTLGYTYGLWDTRVIKVIKNPYLMCFSYRWYGEKKTYNFALPDFDTYKVDPENDYLMVKELHKLFDEADIVVAHNAAKFDNRVATAYFMQHGLKPPSPYKTVDTLQAARRFAKFGSNSLNSLGEMFNIGTKTEISHGDLWYKCLQGDKKAWRDMVLYNNQDVDVLYNLYEKLLPYISNHPNIARLENRPEACPKCGESETADGNSVMQSRGYRVTNVGKYRRYQCQACGGWCARRQALDKTADVKPSYVSLSA